MNTRKRILAWVKNLPIVGARGRFFYMTLRTKDNFTVTWRIRRISKTLIQQETYVGRRETMTIETFAESLPCPLNIWKPQHFAIK
jgi:hypothetical protein